MNEQEIKQEDGCGFWKMIWSDYKWLTIFIISLLVLIIILAIFNWFKYPKNEAPTPEKDPVKKEKVKDNIPIVQEDITPNPITVQEDIIEEEEEVFTHEYLERTVDDAELNNYLESDSSNSS